MKHPTPGLLDYCRDFGKAMRDIYSANSNWSVKYFTHLKSYYPVPELAMDLSALAKLYPISVVLVDKTNIAKTREWAREHEQCVRKLNVRQQTIKFSAGTLPMSQPMGYKPTTRSSQQQCGRRSH